MCVLKAVEMLVGAVGSVDDRHSKSTPNRSLFSCRLTFGGCELAAVADSEMAGGSEMTTLGATGVV